MKDMRLLMYKAKDSSCLALALMQEYAMWLRMLPDDSKDLFTQ
jgi:hypothetical protein